MIFVCDFLFPLSEESDKRKDLYTKNVFFVLDLSCFFLRQRLLCLFGDLWFFQVFLIIKETQLSSLSSLWIDFSISRVFPPWQVRKNLQHLFPVFFKISRKRKETHNHLFLLVWKKKQLLVSLLLSADLQKANDTNKCIEKKGTRKSRILREMYIEKSGQEKRPSKGDLSHSYWFLFPFF